MDKHLEQFTRNVAQDVLKRTGELAINVFSEQNPWFKPSLEELQNGNRRYPKTQKRQTEKVIRDKSNCSCGIICSFADIYKYYISKNSFVD